MSKKILLAVGALSLVLALYAASGFYGIPRLVQNKIPVLSAELTGQPLQLEDVRFNPFELKAELQGGHLLDGDGRPLFAFDALVADVAVFESLKQGRLVLSEVWLDHAVADVTRYPDGRFNFSDMLDKAGQANNEQPEAAQAAEPVSWWFQRLTLTAAKVNWREGSADAPAQSLALDVRLNDLAAVTEPPAGLELHAAFDAGGTLDWQGELALSPFASQGRLKLEQLELPGLWQAFVARYLPLNLTGGSLSLETDYAFDGSEATPQLRLNNGRLSLTRLALQEKAKAEPLIQLPRVDAQGITFDLRKQTVDIAAVGSKDGIVKTWLQQDGRVNYQALFPSAATGENNSQAATAEAAGEQAWRVAVQRLALENHRVEFTDYSRPKPVLATLSELALELEGYGKNEQALPVRFSTRINQQGKLALNGNLALAPFAADWALDLQGVALKPFQAYMAPYLRLDWVDGFINAKGRLQLAAAGRWQARYSGDAGIEHLLTRDKAKNQDFVKWAKLDLQQIALDTAKQDYHLGRVVFDRPYLRFTIKQNGTTNFADLLAEQAVTPEAAGKSTSAKKPAESPAAGPVVKIGKVAVKDGQSDFADYSLILPFVVTMNGLNGEVDGFDSATDTAAKLKLHGKVHDLAPVKIAGNYRFKSKDADIGLSFKHLPLPLVTPYMAEFAGYRIEKGQMTLDLNYSVKRGQLQAQNKVFIDQLQLGDKVDNPKAVSLPLELAIALLKDADGKINLDFPISGSLEDPQFSIGSVLADVLTNLVEKAVTYPFDAIASLFEGDQDFSLIAFADGSSELSAEEKAKLDQIAKALAGKPELVLEVKGIAYQAQDWPALRYDAVEEILKKMKSGELRDKGEQIRSEYIELDESERKRLLAKFYAEVFPDRIDYSLFGKPRSKSDLKADFYPLAQKELEAKMQPEPERLNALAVSRANRIAKYLTEQAGVDRSRIYILASELAPEKAENGVSARLSLNLAP